MHRPSLHLVACAISLCAFFLSCKNTPPDASAGEASTPAGPTLFEKMPASHTGIDFANVIQDDGSANPLIFNYVYMSGAVGVGDFNNDGLADLYCSATTGANRLYLNRGDFKFEDVAAQAGVTAAEGLKTGVTVIDINNDGWLDIYQCRTGTTPESRSNLLFINTGNSPSVGGGAGGRRFHRAVRPVRP